MNDKSGTQSNNCPLGKCIYCHHGVTHTRHIIRKTKTEYEKDLRDAMYKYLLDH